MAEKQTTEPQIMQHTSTTWDTSSSKTLMTLLCKSLYISASEASRKEKHEIEISLKTTVKLLT